MGPSLVETDKAPHLPRHGTVALLDDKVRDRARGALVGLAVGDALGTTLEFAPRDTCTLHVDMLGGGPFNLQPGQWTDDTAMALALADSLLTCRRLDAHDLMTRFVAWWREGRYSCTGTCFDIGTATRDALARFERNGEAFAGSTSPCTAGNGSLMRLAPVALFAFQDTDLADQIAGDQSRTTHAAPEAVDGCRYFVRLLQRAILVGAVPRSASGYVGERRRSRSLFSDLENKSVRPCWSSQAAVRRIAEGAWRAKTRADIRSTGYVLDTLEAALWSVASTASFEEALILAVNLAGDADTVGAVTGQLAGAIYGASAIPTRWLTPLAWRERIMKNADELIDCWLDSALDRVQRRGASP